MAEIKTVLTDSACEQLYFHLFDVGLIDGEESYAIIRAIEAAVLSANAGKVDEAVCLPYGIVDPDYARIFTIARVLAWSEGYAITMHGSFTRDLDLLAVPWADRVCEPEHLVRRIESACGLKQTRQPPSEKPHGRLAWTLLFPEFGDPRFVDLSVMTCAQSPTQQAIDEPIDRYGRTAAQERQRQIDNRLLQLIQRFFPSLPVAPGYTDWSHWLRFANEAAKIHASQPLAEVKP